LDYWAFEEQPEMIEFEVKDITCGHCIGTVTAAVKAAVPNSTVTVDLPQHIVRVQGAVNAGAVQAAIRNAGYSPERSA
jgi:copper chaperone